LELRDPLTSDVGTTHTHILNANSGVGNVTSNLNAVLAKAPANFYASAAQLTTMNAGSVTNAGGNQPHTNQQPYLVLSFCIALQGIFPSQN
jgi:microcystin-dependent protein